MSAFFKKTLSFLGLAEEDYENNQENEFSYSDYSSKNSFNDYKNSKAIDDQFNSPGAGGFFNRGNSSLHKSKLQEENSKKIWGNNKNTRKLFAIDGAKDSNKIKVSIAQPHEFEEVQNIGDDLKLDIPVIVNLQDTNSDLAKRIIDFCSGLTYALEGSIKKVADRVFLITPKNIIVESDYQDSIKEKSLYNQL